MSQALKDHIWGQLHLRYTMKQIYDKHKAIWWARINAREMMTQDNFIKQQNIAYLDPKHKGVGIYTKTLPFLSTHGCCIIWMMCFISKI